MSMSKGVPTVTRIVFTGSSRSSHCWLVDVVRRICNYEIWRNGSICSFKHLSPCVSNRCFWFFGIDRWSFWLWVAFMSTGRLNVFPSITRSTVTVLGVVVGDDAFYWLVRKLVEILMFFGSFLVVPCLRCEAVKIFCI